MLRPRITPCLLVRDGGLEKTVKFGPGKYVGDPINAVRIFNEKTVDELIMLDISATVDGTSPDFGLIERAAAECRMPLCYGGGVQSVADAKTLIGIGVEKVAMSSAAIAEPSLVSEVSDSVGSQSVVVVLDVKRKRFGRDYDVMTHNATRKVDAAFEDLVRQFATRGAGEIVVNSIDRDGTMEGYDLGAASRVRELTDLPLTVIGGAGGLRDIGDAMGALGVAGYSAGSLFVFKGKLRAVLLNYPDRETLDDLISARLAGRDG